MQRNAPTRTVFVILLLSTLFIGQESAAQLQKMQTVAGYAHLPMTFEANQGQTRGGVKFLSRGKGYTAFLTAGGMVLSLRSGQPAPPAQAGSNLAAASNSQPAANTVLQFKLLGAAQNPVVVGEQPLPGKINYFIGRDPAKWQTNIPTYARVRYKNVYPGIDLVYYGSNQQLEYDFAISPGANPGLIQFEITGAGQVDVDASGNLVLQTNAGPIHFQSPIIYQESNGSRVPVAGTYVMNDSTHVSFHVAQYDSTKPLVIDPVLVYSTYLGGSGDEQPAGIAVDAAGNVYIAGYTDSADFPLATLGTLPAGQPHVFVAELDATGSNLIYADYIGGNGQDYAYALVLDGADDVYVTGSTASSDFPLVNPYQGTYPGAFNGFLTQVSAGGSSLLYSTYLGGNGSDQPAGIAIDGLGEVIVAGNTTSTNFPVANAYQATMSANDGGVFGNYGFVTKFNPSGSSLVYSTYLGGNSNVPLNCGGNSCWPSPFNGVYGVAVDSSGNAYATGSTNTSNFPTTQDAYLTTNSTQQNAVVGFVSKFSTSGALDYSTYLYESSGLLTNLAAIAVDSSGSAYVTGAAVSDGTFPITSTSICDSSVSGWACSYSFVTKFDPTGSTLSYSTFLGLNNYASPAAIALDANNDAYVVASTSSGSFALVNGIEAYPNGNDLLLVEIDPLASTELLATYLGGSGDDYASGIALDAAGNIYVAGSTDSTDFPVTPGAFQTVLGGGADAFLLKIAASAAPAVAPTPGSLLFALQAVGSTSQPQTVLLRNMGSSALSISSIITTGDFAETNTCGTSLPAAGNCTLSATFTPTAAGSRSGSIVIQDDAAGSPHVVALSGSASAPVAVLSPTSLTFSAQQIGTSSASQAVTLTNNGNAALSVGTIQTTGDFAQTNNCSTALATGASCNISITFTATASGTRSGTLTVNDNSAGGAQTANLTGSGTDFGLTSAPNSNSITPGSTANYTLTISSVGGSFASAVKLACSGLPVQTSCSFSPGSVTPGTSNATSTLSISTTASTAMAIPFRPLRTGPMLAVWIQLQGIGLFGMILFARKRPARRLPPRFLLILLTAALIVMTGCAGGTGIASQSQTGTTPGTYTITVTGTSGNLQHSLPLSLTVQ
jgi:Beta-propeller repeat/Abnormal spindle-like microcephaly-assoc'd, ASPM-SPD-2-Hydin